MTKDELIEVSKVPTVTLGFWLIKILATTLGETAGDTLSMTWLGETTANAPQSWLSGYRIGTAVFGLLLIVLAGGKGWAGVQPPARFSRARGRDYQAHLVLPQRAGRHLGKERGE